ncbi:MAG: hypothetical protein ACOYYU_17740 [Chloroflexota bacterium]
MNFLERINATLHNEMPDRVPLASYDNLIPRGSFERELRNRGMGLCKRIATISASMPNVSIEQRPDGDATLTIYHTPEGNVQTRSLTGLGRINDAQVVEVEGMIKDIKDYDPVIFMLEDTVFHVDNSIYFDTVRDLGSDGIARDWALDFEAAPYGAIRRYFGEISGLDRWIYAQTDHPDHFAALVEAQTRRDERRLALVADSPAEFLGLGWVEGIWGPAQFKKYELPFYQKWVSYLQSRGKICALHCDATKSMKAYQHLIAQVGFKVVEAFTPPPVGEVSLAEVRQAWGKDTVIWMNFPETVFYSGYEATKQFTIDLLRSDAPGNSLIIGFTEMGLWGAVDDKTEKIFKTGTLAIMDAIDECGKVPISL